MYGLRFQASRWHITDLNTTKAMASAECDDSNAEVSNMSPTNVLRILQDAPGSYRCPLWSSCLGNISRPVSQREGSLHRRYLAFRGTNLWWRIALFSGREYLCGFSPRTPGLCVKVHQFPPNRQRVRCGREEIRCPTFALSQKVVKVARICQSPQKQILRICNAAFSISLACCRIASEQAITSMAAFRGSMGVAY